jgi:hypothetical protein
MIRLFAFFWQWMIWCLWWWSSWIRRRWLHDWLLVFISRQCARCRVNDQWGITSRSVGTAWWCHDADCRYHPLLGRSEGVEEVTDIFTAMSWCECWWLMGGGIKSQEDGVRHGCDWMCPSPPLPLLGLVYSKEDWKWNGVNPASIGRDIMMWFDVMSPWLHRWFLAPKQWRLAGEKSVVVTFRPKKVPWESQFFISWDLLGKKVPFYS